MIDLTGKWALITGASRGIGKLSAEVMAQYGCNLILHGRKKEHCSEILEKVLRYGIQAYAVEAEFSSPEQVEAMLAEIDRKETPVEVILNNAGLQIAYRTEFLNTPVSDYQISFQVNTIAPMQICYHFLPQMEKRGFGRIVNTTSGIDLEPEQAGYSASKAGLDKVTHDLGSKYEGSDIILSLTDPGWCRTDLGGQNAPNSPESAVPGVLVGAFVNDKKSGRCFPAQKFSGMSLEQAVQLAETFPASY